jgi:hypothetical protein
MSATRVTEAQALVDTTTAEASEMDAVATIASEALEEADINRDRAQRVLSAAERMLESAEATQIAEIGQLDAAENALTAATAALAATEAAQ